MRNSNSKFPNFYNRKESKYYDKVDNKLTCNDVNIDIILNVPRFVQEGSYASLFGEQWKQYRKTQLDSYSGSPISENRLNRCLGDLKDSLDGKLVLEAGCGAGRFTEILLKKGTTLVSSDLSSAVEVNIENFPSSENHMVVQADINDMPFADETFDLVICLGVIQHTPNSEQTIENLYNLVKKGGTLVIDHYSLNNSHYLRLAPLFRNILKRKKAEETIPYTQRLVKRFLPWHKRFEKSWFLSMLLNRISPIISYYRAFPQLNDKQQEDWAMLDTHDSLTDWHKNFRTVHQVRKHLTALGAVNIWCAFSGNAAEARCDKPV